MRDWSLGARLAITVFVSFIASTAHAADDMLVMPFRCAVVDGKPVLTPSDEEQGHRIYGERERKKIETCSTVDAKRCRQWTAFRFDMDCGGVRVPWMKVFANASEHTRRRVWENDGRLRVRDTPIRSTRIDDMCARRMGPQMEWSNTSQLCDETSPLTAPTATTMPAGFAPMVGLDAAILSGEAFERMSARWARAEGEPSAVKTAATVKPPSAPSAKTIAAAGLSRPADPAPKAETPNTASSHAPVTVQAASSPADAPAPAPDAHQQPASDLPDAAPVEARIETAAVAEQAAQDSFETAPETMPTTGTAPSPAPEAQPTVLNAAQPARRLEPPPGTQPAPIRHASDETIQEPLTNPTAEAAGDSDHAITYLIVALASGLLMITLLGVHWFGTATPGEGAPAAAPDVQSVPVTVASAPQAQATPVFSATPGPAPHGENALIIVTPRKRDAGQGSHTGLIPAARTLSIGERMPSTKTEALELLGMGVATDDNLTSLKKIIDGLRMNWHPDLASDDRDRRTRELRLKQINAAWEILGGKTAGA